MTDGQTDGQTGPAPIAAPEEIRTKDGTTWTGRHIKRYTLPRTGAPPLNLRGMHVGHASTYTNQGGRWDDYRLYVTLGGRYVLYHEYKTQWQGESGHIEAIVGDSIPAILESARGTIWTDYERQQYPEVINDLLDDADALDLVAETIE